MVQDTDHEDSIAALGPADGVLFETLEARLTDLELYTAADGTLLATTPDTTSVVRLAVTDRGLAAAEVMEEAAESDRTPVDRIDPAPEADLTTRRTRSRGD